MWQWLWRKLSSLYNKFLGISEESNNKAVLIEHGALYDWWRRISNLAFTFRTSSTRQLDQAIRNFSDTVVFEDKPIQELKDNIGLWKLLRKGKSQRFSAVEQLEEQLNKRMEVKSVEQSAYHQYGHFFNENKAPVERLREEVEKSVESTRRFTAGSYGALGFLLQFLDFDYSFLLESLSFVC